MTFPRIMGIVNVTPDSFSDGGMHADTRAAIDHALRLIIDGADMLDVGGESTRPGAEPVNEDEELRRVIPVIEGIRAHDRSIAISVDTSKASVAEAALDVGASIINDVTAGRGDEAMLSLAAVRAVPVILMHMHGEPRTMQNDPQYVDVVRDVSSFLHERVELAYAAGVQHVYVDPGIGFGKTLDHNLELLHELDRFAHLAPVVVGISRKRFLGEVTGIENAKERDLATIIAHSFLLGSNVSVIRVHDVAGHVMLKKLQSALTQFE
jgi:dihydropteroate synthase